jgi:hypothetical protein
LRRQRVKANLICSKAVACTMYADNTGAVQGVCVNGCIQKSFKYIVDARYRSPSLAKSRDASWLRIIIASFTSRAYYWIVPAYCAMSKAGDVSFAARIGYQFVYDGESCGCWSYILQFEPSLQPSSSSGAFSICLLFIILLCNSYNYRS